MSNDLASGTCRTEESASGAGPNECECDFSNTTAYCPDCLREAIEQNHRAGIAVGDGAVARQQVGQSHG